MPEFAAIPSRHSTFRRSIFSALLGVIVVLGAMTLTTSEARADQAVKFMQRVAGELLRAHKANSLPQMTRVIRSRGDVAAIGRFSLGTYYARLKRGRRNSYFNGMTKFMARYVIDQSKSYRVASATVLRPSKPRGRDVLVDTQVTMTSGATYNVQWLLSRRGNTFKVRDINVLSFWVLPHQRNLFRSYVRKANGDVNALVLALNQ
ncbi:MAG: ABC transporter substrate-binding protein [Pseudomonadota bacterium]